MTRHALSRIAIVLCGLLSLAGCATHMSGPDSPPDEIARAVYRHDGPPALTLFTMVNNFTGNGAHTSLMVNASQRVIFDPAGSVQFAVTPERGDVLFGATPPVVRAYELSHARSTYHVRIQRIEVPIEVAEQALALVMDAGTIGQARCTIVTTRILQQLPGFQEIGATYFPGQLAKEFATLPGVQERRVYDEGEDDKTGAIAAFDAQLSNQRAQETQLPQPQLTAAPQG